jgi:hypothetical protein
MIYIAMPYKVRILPPAAKFLDTLPDQLRAKAARSIVLLREFGPFLREPHAKKVTDWQGLFELIEVRQISGQKFCPYAMN